MKNAHEVRFVTLIYTKIRTNCAHHISSLVWWHDAPFITIFILNGGTTESNREKKKKKQNITLCENRKLLRSRERRLIFMIALKSRCLNARITRRFFKPNEFKGHDRKSQPASESFFCHNQLRQFSTGNFPTSP